MDIFLVRKLGVPGYPELAMGAIASGGVIVLNDEAVRGYRFAQLRKNLLGRGVNDLRGAGYAFVIPAEERLKANR